MMQKEGIITRARHYKEDISIFQFLQNQGMLLESETNDPEAAIQRFRSEIAIHPQVDLKKAEAEMKRRTDEEERINAERRQQKEARAQALELKRQLELLALQKKFSRYKSSSIVDPSLIAKITS